MGAHTKRGAQELPFRQVAQFWNWLPAFRAVAEAGGVNEAARLLRVSPSALSRSVACLESALGEPLFFREGGLVLTAFGEGFLTATRDAMRGVHEATQPHPTCAGRVTLGTTSQVGLHRLLPALRALRQSSPRIEPHMVTIRESEVAPLLLRGQLDLAVVAGTSPPKRLTATALPPARCHVYCGRKHLLHGERRPSEAKVASHPFAAPTPIASSERPPDGWPASIPRKVALTSDSVEPRIDACVRGELLVCLPDEVVEGLGLTTVLRALPTPKLGAVPLVCIYRRPVSGRRGIVEEIVELLAAERA